MIVVKICPNCGKEVTKTRNIYCSQKCYLEFKHKGIAGLKCHSYAQGELTIVEWAECLEYFKNQCAYCGNKRSEKFNLEKEHFIPDARKGKLDKDNVVPACKSCNISKGKNDPLNWYKQQKFFSKDRLKKILEYLGYI